jgi:ubiquitin carboxyl-terminal hydrolase 36/42
MANLDGLSEKEAGQKRVRSTLVYQHFAGTLRSSVTCKECRHVSSTDDVLLDLPLDIYDRNVNSLQTAMRAFAAVEQLEPNTYMCEKCKKRVSASKKFRVEVLPQYLTIQLKRFGLGTTKISKSIEFPHRLNAKDVASENLHPADCQYHLCGVLVHYGATQCGGHYKAYVRLGPATASAAWYECDDSRVQEVHQSSVMNQRQGAYLLFYERITDGPAGEPSTRGPASQTHAAPHRPAALLPAPVKPPTGAAAADAPIFGPMPPPPKVEEPSVQPPIGPALPPPPEELGFIGPALPPAMNGPAPSSSTEVSQPPAADPSSNRPAFPPPGLDPAQSDTASVGPRLSHGSPKPGEEAEEKTVLSVFPQNAAPVKGTHQVLRLGAKPSAAPKQEPADTATTTGVKWSTAPTQEAGTTAVVPDNRSASSKPEVPTAGAPSATAALLAGVFERVTSSWEQKSGLERYSAALMRQHILPKRKCDEAALEGLRREAKRFAVARPGASKRDLALELQRAFGPQLCLGREFADGRPFMGPPKALNDANGFVESVREDEVQRAVSTALDKILP